MPFAGALKRHHMRNGDASLFASCLLRVLAERFNYQCAHSLVEFSPLRAHTDVHWREIGTYGVASGFVNSPRLSISVIVFSSYPPPPSQLRAAPRDSELQERRVFASMFWALPQALPEHPPHAYISIHTGMQGNGVYNSISSGYLDNKCVVIALLS